MRPPLRLLAACLVTLAAALAAPEAATGPGDRKVTVRWATGPGGAARATVEVSGLDPAALDKLRDPAWTFERWRRLLPVLAGQGNLIAEIGLPPMLGDYRIEGDLIRFEPKFGLDPGVRYRATFNPAELPGGTSSAPVVSAEFRPPPRPSERTTTVSHVFPSAEMVPENLLKFYVHFSAPMSGGHIYDHIHLRDSGGREIELPFLEIDEELWNREMTRLTLFIDPGRIKRGVLPLEEVGPALEAGREFVLVIDDGWRDANGNPLRSGHRKSFKVDPPDRDPPDPEKWKITPPAAGTRDAVTIVFPEPMDNALARRLIRITSGSREAVDGEISLDDQERRWRLTPKQPWRAGTHHVVIQTTIEDLAGNNIGKPFEVDLVEPVRRQLSASSVRLPFEVR